MKFNVFKLFLKVMYVCIFQDSSGIAFHNFNAAHLHDLKLQVVDFTFGRSNIVVPLMPLLEHLTVSYKIMYSGKLAGPASLANILKTVDNIFANRCSRRLETPIGLQSSS